MATPCLLVQIFMCQDPFSLGAQPSLSNTGLWHLAVSYLVHVYLLLSVSGIELLTIILGGGVLKKKRKHS